MRVVSRILAGRSPSGTSSREPDQVANASGHGPDVSSLAAVRLAEKPELLISPREELWCRMA